MRECWANSLGGCSETISGEHLVSRGLFDTGGVIVQGLPWCRNEPKTIGLSSLVKNTLCREHNSRLSEADESAKKLRDQLRVMAGSLADEPVADSHQPSAGDINGYSIERWCAKTIVNFASGTVTKIGNSWHRGKPSRSLTEIIFAQRQFQPQAGLYWVGEPGENIVVDDGVRVMFFSDGESRVQGARFTLFGFTLLLRLTKGNPGPLSLRDGTGGVSYPKLLYRPRHFGVKNLLNSTHALQFSWDDKISERCS
jgi:hypothetical protein